MNTRYSGIYQTKSPLLNEALPSKITEVDQNTSHMSYADSYYLGDRKSFYSSFNSTLKRSSIMGGNSGRQITVKDTTNVKRNNYLTPNFRCQQLRADFQNNNQKSKVIDHRTSQNLNTDKCRTDYYENCKQNCKLKLQQSQMYPNNNILTNIEDIDERQEATQSELKVSNEKQSFQKKAGISDQKVCSQNQIKFAVILPKEIIQMVVCIELQQQQAVFQHGLVSDQTQKQTFKNT